ncbi:hypothetical protein PFICI_04111 [Pestalotiopsis fici W106-1]|uniref:Major facilitator superfamily (MFS) profile domain-containing protein n=1 Tax=Pestalotiopsis fici (strain W106-1 / CGMCC3.15140) TaxID=1229662 RepID=W3XLE5_PESFW|nr:uncharacterized protein PFICI_04111 [Pestalotiopsis fici W106-1]ETS86086.1 hypothetical protein PFICI_04111 [Pestalotiopsis fici W106-1]
MTVITTSDRVSGGWLIALVTLVDAMSAMWFGYCQGVFAGVLVSDDFLKLFPQTSNANISGIVTSCFLLGAFFGAILAFVLGDKLGRKKTIMLGHTLNFTGALLQCLSWSLPQMIIGRLVNGFGMGMTSTMSPVYLAECARSHMRGRLLVIGASSNVTSFCIANWISYGLYYQSGPLQWRFPLGFQLIFAFILVPILFFTPESPRWLLLVGMDDDALQVIARLANVASNDATATAEYRSIKEAIRLERESRVPIMDVLCHRDKTQNFRRLILSCGAQFMQQFSGINALGFYLPTLLQQNIGFDNRMSRLLTAIIGTIYFLSAFGSIAVIDHIGRRRQTNVDRFRSNRHLSPRRIALSEGWHYMGNVAVAMFVLYHVFFAPTWGGVPWVYAAEVNSLGWRTRGAAAATATNWIMAFVVVQITKIGLDNLGWAFYLIFAVSTFSYVPVVFCFYPETSSRSLEDMNDLFIRNPSVFVCGKKEMTQCARPMALIEAEQSRIARAEDAQMRQTLG